MKKQLALDNLDSLMEQRCVVLDEIIARNSMGMRSPDLIELFGNIDYSIKDLIRDLPQKDEIENDKSALNGMAIKFTE